jgi:hypothetical protein
MNCKSLELVKSPSLLGYGLMVIAKDMSAVRTTTTTHISVSAVFVGHFTELI